MIVFLLLFLGCFANYQRFYEHGHLIHWVDLGESPSPLRIHHDQGHYLSDLSTVYPNSVLINGSFFYVSEGQHHPVYYLQINKLPYVLASARHGAVGWSDSQIHWDIISPKVSAQHLSRVVPLKGINTFTAVPSLWTLAQKPDLPADFCWQTIHSLKVNGKVIGAGDVGLIQSNCKVGGIKQLRLNVAFSPVYGSEKIWKNLDHVVMGVPLLIKNGRILLTGDEQGDFYQAPFSRTVIGQTKDRHIVLIVVESNLLGDFWWRSTRVWNEMFFPKGMSLMTLSQWLIAHGVINALNLDGGGSTGLALNSQVLVRPKLDFNGVFEPLERKLSHTLLYDLSSK